MFGRSTKTPAGTAAAASRKGMIPSVISADMNVLGNIVSEGMLDIDGKVDGNVRCHSVTIRPNGKIRGDVMAEVVHVHGVVEGLIKASAVTVYTTARVTGTIMHESLSIEDGAFIDGKFKRTDKVSFEQEQLQITHRLRASASLDTSLNSDEQTEEAAPSEAEIHVLKNLRLIS